MTVQHLNAVKSIARTAQTSGAQMPEHISDALRHLDELAAAQSAPFQPGASAKEIAKHLGDRTAMEKATKAASIRLATDEARLRSQRHPVEVCATRILGMMHGSSEQISAAFGVALA